MKEATNKILYEEVIPVLTSVAILSTLFLLSSFIDAQTIPKLYIDGVSASIEIGQAVHLRAMYDPYTCRYISGCVGVEDVTQSASWSSLDNNILHKDRNGVFSARGIGVVTISATYGGFTARESVSIVASGSGGGPSTDPTNYDVVLEEVLLEMPGAGFFINNQVHLSEAAWLDNGYFLVTAGFCNAYSSQHGVWAFKGDGTLIGERHTCIDSVAPGERQNLYLWAHNWGSGNHLSIVDGTRFVIGGISGSSKRYPPKLYEVKDSGISLLAKTWSLVLDSSGKGSVPPRIYNQYDLALPRVQSHTVSNSRLITNEVHEDESSVKTVVYSIPDLAIVNEIQGRVTFLGAIGDLIVGAIIDRSTRQTKVFKLVNDDLQEVQVLSNSIAHHRMVLNPVTNQVLLGVGPNSRLYKLEGGQLVEDDSSFVEGTLAMRDDYFAKGYCDVGQYSWMSNCKVEVWKGSEKLTSQTLPNLPDVVNKNPEGVPASLPQSIAISPSGKLLAVTQTGAYLYQIKNFTGTAPSEPQGTEPGTTPSLLFDTSLYLQRVNSYLETLQELLNRGTGDTGGAGSDTRARIDAIRQRLEQITR